MNATLLGYGLDVFLQVAGLFVDVPQEPDLPDEETARAAAALDVQSATMGMALLLCLQDPVEVQKWISDLSHDDVDVREQATRKLIEAGEKILPDLKAALRTDNLERKARLERVLAEVDAPACAQVIAKALALKGITDRGKLQEAQLEVWGMLQQMVAICDKESGLKIGAQAWGEVGCSDEDFAEMYPFLRGWEFAVDPGEGAYERCVLVVDGNVELRSAKRCVIVASGDVKAEKATGCVILARGTVDIEKISGGVVLAGGDLKGSLAYKAEVGAYGKVHGVKLAGGAALWGEGFAEPWGVKGVEVGSKRVRLILKALQAKP